ncbi:cation/H(+) antiporter 15-like [Aristolochia californica]|uniref:cation/H(+) antiporter 15-like n=1 Tax=Aristolochia californica TaxID=171875 RepID=UPI0035E29C2E
MALNRSINQLNRTDFLPNSCMAPQRIWSYGFYNHNRSLYYSLPLLLFQIVIFTSIAGILRLILRPFKQPRIISEILAGIIVGPTVLGAQKHFDSLIFPVRGQVMLDTLAWIAIIYYVFVEGLKQDISVVTRARKKELIIGFIGIMASYVLCALFVFMIERFLPDKTKKLGILNFMPGPMAISSFPVIQPILVELGLLKSELGRLSMSLSMLNTTLSSIVAVINQTARHSRRGLKYGIYSFLSSFAMIMFLIMVARPATLWIIRRIPEGRRVDSNVVVAFLLLSLVFAAISDAIGAVIFIAPFIFALQIPPGPPLGSVLVEKVETVLRYFLLPIFFVVNGRNCNLLDVEDWSTWWLVQLTVFSSCFGKFMGTMLTAQYYKMPYQESVTLALIMCFKGVVELLVFSIWKRFQVCSIGFLLQNGSTFGLRSMTETFELCSASESYVLRLPTKLRSCFVQVLDGSTMAALQLAMIAVTAFTTPLVRNLARRSTKPLFANYGSSIQQTKPNGEFRLLMCVHDEDNVPTLLNLLNASNGTKARPINLCLLHLVELVGRGVPILTAHKVSVGDSFHSNRLDHIVRAFQNLVKRGGGHVLLNPFTSVSPYNTMHQDVCKLATDMKVCLVIVPLHKHAIYNEQATVADRTSRLVVRNILYEAHCSVGVLLDRSNLISHVPRWTATAQFSFRVGTVFFGGADDREALCYVSRMVENHGVSLLALRCLAPYSGLDHERERLLDDELIGEFRLKTLQQDDVVYREQMTIDVESMMNSIRSMGSDFDLMIVGRRHPAHSLIMGALSDWSEFIELGVIGDFLASSDFGKSGASVLAIQHNRIISSLANTVWL